MNGHLTSQQVTDWRSGVTDAEELLRLDDHLAECPACRALVAKGTLFAVRGLRDEFSSGHLAEGQLDDYAQSRPLPADVMQHLDLCESCRDDANDLRKFAETTPAPKAAKATRTMPIPIRSGAPVWLRSLAAAVAVAALGLAVRFAIEKRSDQPTQPEASSANSAPAEVAFNIPEQYRDEVKAAMDSGNIRIPPAIGGLATGPVQLRSTGSSEAKSSPLHVISPTGTGVVEDQPVFRWTPVEGATYTISVYDDQFHAMESAKYLKEAEWHPDKPLRRGAVYRWEVRAVRGKQVDIAPAPTEAEARFMVLGVAAAKRLTDAQAAMPNAPLALGILYANSGALDDAKRELAQAAAGNDEKQKALAAQLLAKLK